MRRIITISAILIIIIVAAWGALAYYATYSDGYRVGVITKFSRKGMIFKTYEGELDLGYLKANGGGIGNNIFYFSVENKESKVLEAINKASDKGYPIKLYYKERYWKLPFLGETIYFITKGELIDSPINHSYPLNPQQSTYL